MRFLPRGRRGVARRLLLGAVALVAVAFAVIAGGETLKRRSQPAPPILTDLPGPDQEPLVFTYLFYWYDSVTGGHLQPQVLNNHPPPDPPANWRSVAWFRKELSDMAYVGIDVVLPVYWGRGEEWSPGGLPVLAQAIAELRASGQPVPSVGMFYDTTILKGQDLTSPQGMAFFYSNIKDFFSLVPREQWALVRGRPIVWLFLSFFAKAYDQAVLDNVYRQFGRDFGVRPYIVRDTSWDYTFRGLWRRGRPVFDYKRPLSTENSYGWNAAYLGYSPQGGVASVGPGYDERGLPGRAGAYRARDDGRWYVKNFAKAIASEKRWLALETWNEFHEASGISETVEHGRQYLELSRGLVQRFKASRRGHPTKAEISWGPRRAR